MMTSSEPKGTTKATAQANGSMRTIKFTLDGRGVEAADGETIWQAAQRHGTDITHLCYSPEPGYRADDNCRAGMVEIEGERVLAASCIRKPRQGHESNHRLLGVERRLRTIF
jgi:formate dehydrogenase major subunit